MWIWYSRAGLRETVVIDLSEGYDIEELEKPLPDKDHYYLVLTNNNCAFGQGWMCSIAFDESVICEVPKTVSDNHLYEEKKTSVYEAPLAYDAWCWPTESKNISNLYGEGKSANSESREWRQVRICILQCMSKMSQ